MVKMPSYAIHLAVAEEYLRKHDKQQSENYQEFIEGVIYPDTVKDKSKTHYGEYSSKSNLYRFLQENNMDNSFKRGCFLHLLTDYIFYNQYIEYWSKDIYHDYSILNDDLIKKYHVTVPEDVEGFMESYENSQLKILTVPMIEDFIDEVSKLDIISIANEVEDNPEKWTRFRPLKEI